MPPGLVQVANVGLRGTGYVSPSDAALRALPIRRVEDALLDPVHASRLLTLTGGGAVLPDSFSWRPFTHEPFDQGSTKTCVGAGGATFAYLGGSTGWIPSPATISRGTRAKLRSLALGPGASATTSLPNLVDEGASYAELVLWLAGGGVVPFRGPTPDGRNYDLSSAADLVGIANPPAPDDDTELTELEVSQGLLRRFTGASLFDTASASLVTLMKQALLVGPVGRGGYIDSQVFDATATSPPIGPPVMTDPNLAQHFFVIVGWRPSVLNDGTSDWIFQQSWGKNYWDGGFGYARQGWASSSQDLIAATLKPV
jgi:hypothetical protein